MKEQKMSLIGVIGNGKENITFGMIKDIFINSGFSIIYRNEKDSIIFLSSLENNYIGIANISSENLNCFSNLGLKFKVIVYTNIENKVLFEKELKSFFTDLESIIVLNIDGENNIELLKGNNKALVITYGLNNKSTITASSLDIDSSIKFNFCLQRQIGTLNRDTIEPLEFPVEIKLLGKEYIYSALASISVALCYGLNTDIIREALLNTKSSSRKMEKIHRKKFMAIDNFCLNPIDYSNAFETIQHLKYRNIVLLNGIEIEQEIYIIEENLEVVFGWVPILGIKEILFFINGRNELIEKKIEYFFYRKEASFKIYYDLDECIKYGIKFVGKDDIFLFLGSDILEESKKILTDEIG